MPDQWFRFDSEALNDPRVQLLSPAEFRAKFFAAIQGEQNEFSPHMRPGGTGRPSVSIWARLRSFVFDRDDYTCRYCGVRRGRLECDHVIPVSRGGSSEPDNLATACFPCNRSKRDKTPEEWGGQL